MQCRLARTMGMVLTALALKTTSLLVILTISSVSIGFVDPAWSQPHAAPPPTSIESMKRGIKMGRDRGFTGWLTPVEITDSRFNPFIVQIRLTAEGSIGLNRVRFVTDSGEFETEIRPQDLPKLQGAAFGDTPPPSRNATLTLTRIEDRSFNIDTEHAGWLATTSTLEVTVYGRLRERNFTVTKKALGKLQDWLAPRVAKYQSPR